MSVLGFNFRSINARIGSGTAGEVTVKNVPDIESIEKRDLSGVGIKEAVSVGFRFTTAYEPEGGEIVFTGELIYQVKNAEDIERRWNNGEELDEKMLVDILNTIFRRCLSKSIEFADALKLPPPLVFPVVRPKPKDKAEEN